MQYLTGEKELEAVRWMNKAAEIAEKALCLKAKCGTVIVRDGEIIGAGYNAPANDDLGDRMCLNERNLGKTGYDYTCCVHAEWRAIMDAIRRNDDKIKGSKLYFVRVDENGNTKRSGQPYCTVCSRLALDTGIGHFLLWHEQGIGEYPTDEYNRLSYQYVKPVK